MMPEPTVDTHQAQSLRGLRAEHVLSIRELAQLAGVAPSAVYLIEHSRTTPRPSVMRRIAAALEVDAHQVAEFRRAIADHGQAARRAHPRSLRAP